MQNINLETYVLAAMVTKPEALTYAYQTLRAEHFSFEQNSEAFQFIIDDYRSNQAVNEQVTASRLSEAGIFRDPLAALSIFRHEKPDQNWEDVINELAHQGQKSHIKRSLTELSEATDPPEVIATRTIEEATEWLRGSRKRYKTGREIDEEGREESERVVHGVQFVDDELHKYGGDRRGQMRVTILREKHGKTRRACWEVANDLLYGHTVHYCTLEGRAEDIRDNVRQILMHRWKDCRERLLITDATVNTDQLLAAITETVIAEGASRVYMDYAQLMMPSRYIANENDRINTAIEALRAHMVRHNYNCHLLSQSRKQDPSRRGGFREAPTVQDAYGSMAMIKAATLISTGIRPKLLEGYLERGPLGTKIKGPNDHSFSPDTVFFKTIMSRQKPINQGRWYYYQDSDSGLHLKGWATAEEPTEPQQDF